VVFGADEVRIALRTSWQCSPGDCVPLSGSLWRVSVGGEVFAAKRLPLSRRVRFEAGLRAAECLEAAGIAAGAPIRAADGALTVAAEGGVLALLRWVPGRPLRHDDPIEGQWWGNALAAAHRALARFTHPGLAPFQRVRPEAPHLALEDWLGPAVRAAIAAVRKLCVTDQLTYGVLHGNPSHEDFRLDPETGKVGLIGWSDPGGGPLVYDVAAAVHFAGGTDASGDLLDGYLAGSALAPASTVTREECDAALPTMLRFRAAVLADRIAAHLFAGGSASVHAREADRAALAAVRLLLV
jgi:homoserine kinase type II